MKVYILTSEPYHDNSSIQGVYPDETSGLQALRDQWPPTTADFNMNDGMLTEWDLETNTEGRIWQMHGKQIREVGPLRWDPTKTGPRPVRKEFTLIEPEEPK